jgi:DNA-binding CsgD family transcriptional regulator
MPTSSESEVLVDLIYEAAIIPDLWSGVLDSISKKTGFGGATIFETLPYGANVVCSPGVTELYDTWLKSPWVGSNPRAVKLAPLKLPEFISDHEHISLEEMKTDPFYNLIRGFGFHWCCGTTIRSPGGTEIVFSFEKATEGGPVTDDQKEHLNQLRPHLARASVISARIGLEVSKERVDALQIAGVPAAIVSSFGSVVAANDLFVSLAPTISIIAFNKIRMANEKAQWLYESALSSRSATGGSFSIPMKGSEQSKPGVVHVTPLIRQSRNVFSGADILIYVTLVGNTDTPSPQILEALFDLSPAEARVARCLAEGLHVDAIAAKLGVQENTVRTHLKGVYAKTGTSRQAELISFLK